MKAGMLTLLRNLQIFGIVAFRHLSSHSTPSSERLTPLRMHVRVAVEVREFK